MHEISVTFQPSGKTVYVLPGTSVLEAAAEAGIIIENPCGGNGTCGKCLVKMVSGDYSAEGTPGNTISDESYKEGYRLACRTRVKHDSRVYIPETSSRSGTDRILTETAQGRCSCRPPVRKIRFKLFPPSRKDPASDYSRFRDQVGEIDLSLEQLRHLSGFLRRNNWTGTAVTGYERLLAIEKDDTSERIYGVAFDLGTTTIAGTLIDLRGCRKITGSSAVNRQIGFGDDVISRISSVMSNKSNLEEMRLSAIESINGIIGDMTDEAGISHNEIYDMSIAGNAPMQQILCGMDPSPLGKVPFTQAFDRPLKVMARELGAKIHPEGEVYVFPQIGGFIGGDTVAGLVGVDFIRKNNTSLFVDIGTNGEIVLNHRGQIIAASTAAGPALEGARILQGMRGSAGAIEKVIMDQGDIIFNVIGNTKPVGICGSGLIDSLSILLSAGIIGSNGKLRDSTESDSSIPEAVRKRVITREGKRGFVLATEEESGTEGPVCLWQKDISELQLAVAAIRAGVEILMQETGITGDDIDEVLLAGGFGNFIRRKHAQRCGLIPDIPHDRVKFVGNAVLQGTEMALVSKEYQDEAAQIQGMVRHVDISLSKKFNDLYADFMMFPEGK